MKFFATLPIAAGLFSAVSAVDRAGSFTIWAGPGCDDSTSQRTEFQGIPSNECGFLPGASFKLSFLLGPQQNPSNPQCLIRLYRGQDCVGDAVTYSPADYDMCKDISDRFSYRIENC